MKKRINWKKRYLNLRKKLKHIEEENSNSTQRINNYNWEVDTGRREGSCI